MKNPIKNTALITKISFENRLKDFGLKIEIDSIVKYLDTHPQNTGFYAIKNPKVFTINFVDSTGFGWANVNSNFYKNHTTKKTDLFKTFKNFIESNTFKIGQHYFI